MRSEEEVLLEIRNLEVRFEPQNLPPDILLDAAQLVLYRGKIHFLLGGNGTGKTSFLKTIIGLLPENKGSLKKIIHLPNGMVLNGYDLPQKIKIGYIPQHPHEALIPSFNVSENISFRTFFRGNNCLSDWLFVQRYDKRVLDRVVDIVESFEITKGLLSGKINDGVTRLSGGEQQILNLAAMIFDECELLIMDEPTSKLDKRNRENFWQFIAEVKRQKNITMLIVTHDTHIHEVTDIGDMYYAIEEKEKTIVMRPGTKS